MEKEYCFFGTVESCVIDEGQQCAVLCFICESIKDETAKEKSKIPCERMPMAAVLSMCVSAPERVQITSLRKDDKMALYVHRYPNNQAVYKVRNLTLKQKYLDVKAYMGGEADALFSQEGHSLAEKIGYPASFEEDPETGAPYGREHMV